MKLKLDLHPIFNDTRQIEASLQGIIDEAVAKRAAEVEIIPGKGSGALKKSVLRFLERPDIKALYHRVEKDGDNWGRLFVHFRWDREPAGKAAPEPQVTVPYTCFCCQAANSLPLDDLPVFETGPQKVTTECPSCGSPNRVTVRSDRKGKLWVTAESGYE
jgi:hypothetical protein